jgi:hypothetical protein
VRRELGSLGDDGKERGIGYARKIGYLIGGYVAGKGVDGRATQPAPERAWRRSFAGTCFPDAPVMVRDRIVIQSGGAQFHPL